MSSFFPKRLTSKDDKKIIEMLANQVPQYLIAKKLKVERHTLYRYIREHPELVAAVEDAEESFKDSVEYLFKQKIIKDKDLHAAMWYADRKMRSRGYGEHIENDVNMNGRVVIKIGKIPLDKVKKPDEKKDGGEG